MADEYATELQASLIQAMLDDAQLATYVDNRVYDEPGDVAQRPYVSIGTISPRPLRSSCETAATIDFSIEVHSRPSAGRTQATFIAQEIVRIFDIKPGRAQMSVAGFRTVQMRWRDQVVEREADGKSYTAVVAFTTVLEV